VVIPTELVTIYIHQILYSTQSVIPFAFVDSFEPSLWSILAASDQRLRLALWNGLNWVGAPQIFPPEDRKQIKLPKRRVLSEI
jgi:hypothetical protein